MVHEKGRVLERVLGGPNRAFVSRRGGYRTPRTVSPLIIKIASGPVLLNKLRGRLSDIGKVGGFKVGSSAMPVRGFQDTRHSQDLAKESWNRMSGNSMPEHRSIKEYPEGMMNIIYAFIAGNTTFLSNPLDETQ
jgi:hypothetical protein